MADRPYKIGDILVYVRNSDKTTVTGIVQQVFAYNAHSDKPFDTKYPIGGLVTPGDNSAAAESLTGAPRRGSIWRHYKGGLYTVLGCTFLGTDLHPATILSEQTAHVVYLSGHGDVWVRRMHGADGWLTPVRDGAMSGLTRPRFTEVQTDATGKPRDVPAPGLDCPVCAAAPARRRERESLALTDPRQHDRDLLSDLFDTVLDVLRRVRSVEGPYSVDRDRVLHVVHAAIRKFDAEAYDHYRRRSE
jgi:hypothetical protein